MSTVELSIPILDAVLVGTVLGSYIKELHHAHSEHKATRNEVGELRQQRECVQIS